MKKTIVTLGMLAVLIGCKEIARPTKIVANEPSPAGVYELVAVDGVNIPGMIDHDGHEVMLHSGTFIINTDKTCISKTVFTSEKIYREVKATYTQEGSTLHMQWIGAGRTEGTVEGDTFTMDNHGMIFVYKKQPEL
jgi:hypothetical protein